MVEPALEALGAEAARIEHREPRHRRGLERERRPRRGRRADGRVLGPPRADAGSILRGPRRPARRGRRRLSRGRAAPDADPAGSAVRSRRGDVAADAAAGRGRLDLRAADPGRALRSGRRRRLGGGRARPPAAARGAADLSVPARAVLGRCRARAGPAPARRRSRRCGTASRRRDGDRWSRARSTSPWRRIRRSGRHSRSCRVAYAAAALVELGCFTRAGERHTLPALTERWSLPAARRHLLSRWLARLVAAGLLVRRGRGIRESRSALGRRGRARCARRRARGARGHAGPDGVRRALRRAAGRDPVRGGESAGDAVPGGQRRDGRVPLPDVAGRSLHERTRPRRRRGLGPRPAGRPADPGHRGRGGHRRHDLRGAPRAPGGADRLRLHRRVHVLLRSRRARSSRPTPS